MLIFDFRAIGNKLLAIRKRSGMTQSEVAEAAGLSERTYADIERGDVNTRIETILKVCDALQITPDSVLTEENPTFIVKRDELLKQLDACTEKQKETALELLAVYLKSINGI